MQISHSTSTEHLTPRYYRTLGRKNGLIQSLGIPIPSPEEPGIVSAVPRLGDDDQVVENSIGHGIEGAGKGQTRTKAFNAAVGEVTERYCLRFPGEDDLVSGSYEEIRSQGEVVAFEYLDIYDREALATHYEPFDRETTLQWTTGVNLLTGEEVYVPAEHVWFQSGALNIPEFHFPATTNGVAAGPDLYFALLGGLYEVIERDGIMPIWYRQEPPPGIDVESVADRWPDVHEYIVDDIEHANLDIRLFECETTIDVPTVGGIASSETDERPTFVHGSGTSVDPREAVHQAATEGSQGWPYLCQLLLEFDLDELDAGTHDNFKSNVLHYALPQNREEVSLYFEGENRSIDEFYPASDYPDVGDWSLRREYEYVLRKFEAAGVEPIAVDLTTRDVLHTGIRVVRVFAPELVPITPHPVPPTNHPRIEDEVATTEPHPSP